MAMLNLSNGDMHEMGADSDGIAGMPFATREEVDAIIEGAATKRPDMKEAKHTESLMDQHRRLLRVLIEGQHAPEQLAYFSPRLSAIHASIRLLEDMIVPLEKWEKEGQEMVVWEAVAGKPSPNRAGYLLIIDLRQMIQDARTMAGDNHAIHALIDPLEEDFVSAAARFTVAKRVTRHEERRHAWSGGGVWSPAEAALRNKFHWADRTDILDR